MTPRVKFPEGLRPVLISRVDAVGSAAQEEANPPGGRDVAWHAFVSRRNGREVEGSPRREVKGSTGFKAVGGLSGAKWASEEKLKR